MLAETLSQAKQAEAQRDLDIKKANYVETVKKQQAQADKAYEIQTNIMQQQVVAEAVRVQQIERESQIKVQEAEIMRREKELIATVLKPAEMERQRISVLAEAEKSRLSIEAEGSASATRMKGEAEADIIFKKGDAEARAMNVKAEAFQEYNQAAVIDRLLTPLPEIVRAIASPLEKVDKITIVSTGNGSSTGMHKLTGDMTEIAAQVPALFEALSGTPMADLLSKVRKIGDKAPAAGRACRKVTVGESDSTLTRSVKLRGVHGTFERVATLVRANLNDLIDRAEDPEKMIKQVILDMENQLLQVKTQVAISMADHHLLQKKQAEHEDKAAEWMRKAELAVDKGQDDLARAALERYQSFTKLAEGYTHQVEDQRQQVDTLRKALEQLDQKLNEARAKSDLLLAQHRRARALEKANDAQLAIAGRGPAAGFDRMEQKVQRSEAVSQAKSELVADDVDRRFDAMEKEDEVGRLLDALKARRSQS